MKSRILFATLMLLCGVGVSSASIVCGNGPGEIYFVGVHPRIWDLAGFYYSGNSGETIELRDSVAMYENIGVLLADAADHTLHRLCGGQPWEQRHFLTTDGGFSWNLIDSTVTYPYASGVIPGEIYREIYHSDSLERSIDYGYNYTPCACNGRPDSLGISAAALGPDSGEVYVLGDFGKLFYSQDYAENFTYLCDLYHLYGINPGSGLINGQQPGEVFTFNLEGRIHRVYNYGSNEELLTDFNYQFWYCSATASRTPGELYYIAEHPDGISGGEMHIYHTFDYFQTFTRYVHLIGSEGVNESKVNITPSIINLHVWPNPTNGAFSISYQLNSMKDVTFTMYDILGQAVWYYYPGLRASGVHQMSFSNDELPNGKYFVILRNGNSKTISSITIIK